MADERLRGNLELLVLAALESGPAHGYRLVESLAQRSGGVLDIPEGSLYPALHRLEDAGHIESSWSLHGGRRRRTYSLTHSGTAALQQERAAWRTFSQAVTAASTGLQLAGA
ncbi:PadR family transcriptional regulator [Psychromicrobium xiongbiense]|uniref:PadR family transcriptional regulator n=1 Tax=Psychromicrobium xiongbiense TaxID=3051184 RepID=UPI002557C182|nr:helix-turn-helix transcriptional regulator [Psychromicrobium sp. YIM S02556]